MRATTQPDQLSFSFTTTMIPQGDGSFVVRPGKPQLFLTAKEVAARMRCSVWTVYTLLDDGTLPSIRPTPHKRLVPAAAFERHMESSRDPEFWRQRN